MALRSGSIADILTYSSYCISHVFVQRLELLAYCLRGKAYPELLSLPRTAARAF